MSSSISYEYYRSQFGTSKSGINNDGGFYQTFINATGDVSVIGTIVVAGTSANSVSIAPISSTMPIGVILENGIANGAEVKVVTYGKAQILLENGQSATAGYWCGVSSTTAGRMTQQPNIPNDSTHNREVGHSLQSISSGANVLSYVQIHFN